MDIELNGHKNRTKRARETWMKIAEDYKNGMLPEDIVKQYKKKNGKAYKVAYIYQIIDKVKKLADNE